jgi:transcriptional regulator with XRE-family HTH domain
MRVDHRKRDVAPVPSAAVQQRQALDLHIGGRLRRRRIELGLDQNELARHLFITGREVDRYERGLDRIEPEALLGMSQTLGVRLMYFYQDR